MGNCLELTGARTAWWSASGLVSNRRSSLCFCSGTIRGRSINRHWRRSASESRPRKEASPSMETPQSNLHPEPEHEEKHTGTGNLEPQDGSLSAAAAELDHSEKHEATPETEEIRGDKLRAAVFAKNANP